MPVKAINMREGTNMENKTGTIEPVFKTAWDIAQELEQEEAVANERRPYVDCESKFKQIKKQLDNNYVYINERRRKK